MKELGRAPKAGDSLSLKQVAVATNINYFTIYRAVKSGEIPCHRIGGAMRVFWSEFLESTKIKPAWEQAIRRRA